jgi:4-hydroxy-3-polyprenylbenzoate decarboxylase
LRIREEVSPILEITEITNRVSKSPSGKKALLFERVKGSSMPVLTNAFGSEKRICMALGVDQPDEIGARLKKIVSIVPPERLSDKLGLLKEILGWTRFLPRRTNRSSPPCQEVVLTGDEVDLSRLPILQCWPKDAGRFVTLPLVFTKGLKGQHNVGMYRLQVFDRNTMGMHWHIHKDGAGLFREYMDAGKRMEVAVAIGTDPVVTYAATAPLPGGINEMLLAGFIRQSPVILVKALTVDIEVPAEAEIVVEGYVDPGELRMEGPFGDHTGFYSLADLYPVFHVTAITHRKNAVYSATVVGRPPMEDCYLAKATERIFLPLLQTMVPEIDDYMLPWEGAFHNLVLVSIDKSYPGQAMKIIHGLWGLGQMSFAKAILVLDRPVDFSRGRELVERILDTIDLKRDLLISRGVLDVLDHAAPDPLFGGKVGVDLTRSIDDNTSRRAPDETQIVQEGNLKTRLREAEGAFLDCRVLFSEARHPLILVSVAESHGDDGLVKLLLTAYFLPTHAIIVLFDSYADMDDGGELLWRACANVDPVRDFSLSGNRLVIDGRAKMGMGGVRQWPEEIRMTMEIRDRITARAELLGIADTFVPSRSHYEVDNQP